LGKQEAIIKTRNQGKDTSHFYKNHYTIPCMFVYMIILDTVHCLRYVVILNILEADPTRLQATVALYWELLLFI